MNDQPPREERSKRRHRRIKPAPGAIPGTLIADPQAQPTRMRAFGYGPDGAAEAVTIGNLDEADELRRRWPVIWLDVSGLGNVEAIERIGQRFGLHRLALEDAVNLGQRTKLDEYGDHLYLATHMLRTDEHLCDEQISIFLGKGFVVTIQEFAGDCFDPIRERIRVGRGRIRALGPDYLAYALLDSIIDNYFPLLADFEKALEEIEEDLFRDVGEGALQRIHRVRRDLRLLRRLLWPLEGVMERLMKEKSDLIDDETRLYLRDGHDHAVRIVDQIRTLGDLGAGLMDYHLSMMNNRMNDVMKLLTVVTTIFIPLTFIVGIYGMNFDPHESPWNMPELEWRYGYPAVMLLMAALAAGMVIYFRRKRWL